ncbi:hypothetical protein DPMN_039729 [Dreissena polymorpha]|uniref:G-protein coupled receptors family 2 profile 2 domain-containing protein n=1 Tax=Dreissena polymorpha TaxID=45954 RepID=A0A9D4CTR8_DREPO|nr:hypothetical protein DPMN_039729 [Dreissena polymorpha]
MEKCTFLQFCGLIVILHGSRFQATANYANYTDITDFSTANDTEYTEIPIANNTDNTEFPTANDTDYTDYPIPTANSRDYADYPIPTANFRDYADYPIPTANSRDYADYPIPTANSRDYTDYPIPTANSRDYADYPIPTANSRDYTDYPIPTANFRDYPWYKHTKCLKQRVCGNYNEGFQFSNCHCDFMCHELGDCCEENDQYKIDERPDRLPNGHQFSCEHFNDFYKLQHTGRGFPVASQCKREWTNIEIKDLCERKTDYMILNNPVTDVIAPHIIYRNMYCALCNEVNDFVFWKSDVECPIPYDSTELETNLRTQKKQQKPPKNRESYCSFKFTPPNMNATYRPCLLKPPVSKCPPGSDPNLADMCENGRYFIVYHFDIHSSYRNELCAICNNIPEEHIFCYPTRFSMTGSGTMPSFSFTVDLTNKTGPSVHLKHECKDNYEFDVTSGHCISKTSGTIDSENHNFRMLVDLNTIFRNKPGQSVHLKRECKNNEAYDVLIGQCRFITCPPRYVLNQHYCLPLTGIDDNITKTICVYVKLEWTDFYEYQMFNDSWIYVFLTGQIVHDSMLFRNGTDLFRCLITSLEVSNSTKSKPGVIIWQDLQSKFSFIGLNVSLSFLLITIVAYMLFKQLVTIQGKLQFCLILSLFLAELSFIAAPYTKSIPPVCKYMGVCTHLFFLTTFCWTNIISFDIWRTFSNQFVITSLRDNSTKRFVMYSLYAWCFPLIVLSVAIAIDLGDFKLVPYNIKPRYGQGACWLNSSLGVLIFFIGPLGLMKSFDIFAFVMTAINIIGTRRQVKNKDSNQSVCWFVVHIKLSIVMGLTWVFAIIANISNNSVLWYVFVVTNTLQGMFVALTYMTSNKIFGLLKIKIQSAASFISSLRDSSATQSYSLSGEAKTNS